MSDSKHTFALGIDLGTSNTTAAFCDLSDPELRMQEITQVLGPNTTGEKAMLPSAWYLAHPSEFPEGSLNVPWSAESQYGVVGTFARNHGAQVPDRLVVSAKSWLSHPKVDPRVASLPWMSPLDEGEKVSALQATQRYLEHVRDAFLWSQKEAGTQRNISDGLIVITVPASFDEVARNLTLEAAANAGLGDVVLLEEPQAAFYAWTAQGAGEWMRQVSAGDCVLVCDIGGGTADFSLIVVKDEGGDLALERVSVGEHLLLGGDNMDIGLAYCIQAQVAEQGHELDEWQFQALTHACSNAKVQLFSDLELEQVPISIPTRGSSLVGGTISASLDRQTLESMVLDGFFPITTVDDLPEQQPQAGLQELGLPYAADPVISKQLARFLQRSLANVKASPELSALVREETLRDAFLCPDAVLFNGGIFNAEQVRARVLQLLSFWNGDQEVRALPGYQPDLAVAIGACDYARSRATGTGIRIKAGTPRSYYVGLESSTPAIPGMKPKVKAICIVPQGMEEGSELVIEDREFGLVTGEDAIFRFFMSEVRSGDEPGQILPDAERMLQECANLNLGLSQAEGHEPGEVVPVRIQSIVTETGNLQLWMKHTQSDQRWKFELEIRSS
ncbi:MAG: Hsp70 family protein [Verrucomicrobiae bacterium]|nr:Hsp70 family protein [Verrucomicrobiae bacterium]